jgi:hypothetical protein
MPLLEPAMGGILTGGGDGDLWDHVTLEEREMAEAGTMRGADELGLGSGDSDLM